jgi:hypothetical protein
MDNIDVMLEPLRALLLQVGSFMPRLVLALGVLLVGWLLAKAFRLGVVKALRALNLVILASLIIAFNSLGLTQVTDLLSRVLLFVPRLLVALLVVVFGSYFARFAGNAVKSYCRSAEISDAELLGRIVQYAVMAFVILLAVDHLDIGGGLIQKTFLILLGGVVVALAISFGLGGRDRAAELLERWFPRDRDRRLP